MFSPYGRAPLARLDPSPVATTGSSCASTSPPLLRTSRLGPRGPLRRAARVPPGCTGLDGRRRPDAPFLPARLLQVSFRRFTASHDFIISNIPGSRSTLRIAGVSAEQVYGCSEPGGGVHRDYSLLSRRLSCHHQYRSGGRRRRRTAGRLPAPRPGQVACRGRADSCATAHHRARVQPLTATGPVPACPRDARCQRYLRVVHSCHPWPHLGGDHWAPARPGGLCPPAGGHPMARTTPRVAAGPPLCRTGLPVCSPASPALGDGGATFRFTGQRPGGPARRRGADHASGLVRRLPGADRAELSRLRAVDCGGRLLPKCGHRRGRRPPPGCPCRCAATACSHSTLPCAGAAHRPPPAPRSSLGPAALRRRPPAQGPGSAARRTGRPRLRGHHLHPGPRGAVHRADRHPHPVQHRGQPHGGSGLHRHRREFVKDERELHQQGRRGRGGQVPGRVRVPEFRAREDHGGER